jgi:hypothetical protein
MQQNQQGLVRAARLLSFALKLVLEGSEDEMKTIGVLTIVKLLVLLPGLMLQHLVAFVSFLHFLTITKVPAPSSLDEAPWLSLLFLTDAINEDW